MWRLRLSYKVKLVRERMSVNAYMWNLEKCYR